MNNKLDINNKKDDFDLQNIKTILNKFNSYPKFSEEEEKIINENMTLLNINKKKLIIDKINYNNEKIINENINILETTYNILKKILLYYEYFFNEYRDYINNFSFEIIKESKFEKYEYYFDLYKDINENEIYKYYRIPKSLYNLKTDDKTNFENHLYYIENYLKHEKCNNNYYDIIKNNNIIDIINSVKTCDLYIYMYMNCVVDNIFKEIKNPFFNTKLNINILKETIINIFYPYKKIIVNSTEGFLFKTKLNIKKLISNKNDYLFVFKASSQMSEEYNGIFHEYTIGILLNYLFFETPTFVYTYNGFFCSIFNENFQSLCNITDSIALTNIIVLEYLGEQTLKSILNKLTLNELINIILIILLTLIIAKEKYNFSHNDLHLGNIMIVELDYLKPVKFKFENEEYIIYSKYIPKIIDFGKSSMHSKGTYIYPFKTTQQLNIQHRLIEKYIIYNEYLSSYDWFRFIISLITELYAINMRSYIDSIKYFVLYYEKFSLNIKNNKEDCNYEKTIYKFIEDLKLNKYKSDNWKYMSSLIESNSCNILYCSVNLKELIELI
jgi:hypothetical protein